MNRELKFRAWTKEGRMQYDVVPWHWDFVIDTMSHKCIDSNGEGILGSGGTRGRFEVPGVAFVSIMQYTGLKDKDGREIWEGDIVRVNDKAVKGCFAVGVVELTEGYWRLRGCYHKYHIYPWSYAMEVIGNIHENPDLITP